MGNKRKLRPLVYYLMKCLGEKGQTKFIKYLVYRKCGDYILDLPDDLSSVKNILFILPENPIEALHQVVNIISIINHYSKAQAIFLCEKKIAPYFKNFHRVSSIIEYDCDQMCLFSNEFSLLRKMLIMEYIDLCLFLERDPDLSLLSLVGQIQVKVRVTYSDVGAFPFFNLRIKSANNHVHMTEQNNIMAKMLGAKPHSDLRWSVPKNIIDEITLMFKESSIPTTAWIGGIDAQFFYYSFGHHWTEALIDYLNAQNNRTWYLYVKSITDKSFLNWLKARKMPIFSDLSPPRLAALIYKSDLIISGKAITFELANLLHKPAIGLFEENELHRYCRLTPKSIGVSYSNKPDEQTITRISESVTAFSTPVRN